MAKSANFNSVLPTVTWLDDDNEDALTNAVEQLRCALKITRLGIWRWDLKTQQIALSKELFNITGINSEYFDGTIDYIANEIIHPESKEYFKQAIQADLKSLKVETRDFRINHPDIKDCWVKINGKILFDKNGDPTQMIGTVLDITEDYLYRHYLKSELLFFDEMIETLPNPIFCKDADRAYIFCNKAFLDFLGLKEEEIIGKTVYDISPLELAKIYDQADQALLDSKTSQVYEAQVKHADGNYRDVIFSKVVHLDATGNPLGFVGIMQDVTEQRATEHQLKMLQKIKDVFLGISHDLVQFQSEGQFMQTLLSKLQVIFENCVACTILKLGPDNDLVVVASSGYVTESVSNFKIPLQSSFIWDSISKNIYKAHIINDVQDFIKKRNSRIADTSNAIIIESTLVVPVIIDDKLQWIFSFDSNQNHIYTEAERITADFIREEMPLIYQIFELYQKTLQLSRFDSLTGLINRSYFEQIYEEALLKVQRQHDTLAIVVIDLDGLKKINDELGHTAGDAYLKTFAKCFQSLSFQALALARVGGDEFIGIFSGIDQPTLQDSFETLQKRFEQIPIFIESQCFFGGFSFGIACFPTDHIEPEKLVQIADTRMYTNKSRHK